MHALTLEVGAASADAVCDALSAEFGALSVSIEDAAAGTPAEQPVFDEPGLPAPGSWQHGRVCAHFADEANAEAAAAGVAARFGPELRICAIARLDDRDWVRATQAQFGPIAVDPEFWIVPSWSPVPAAARTVLRLDPGRAFGTGTHPTTRMCLRWIASHRASIARPGTRVLDYGCGSGVLAIAAALFGATEVDAVDIDPDSVAATVANALANGVRVRAGAPEIAGGGYALVVANILATPLRLLAPLLAAQLGDGADLVLAGILERQADELRAAYAPHVRLAVGDADDGWILMTGRASPGGRMA